MPVQVQLKLNANNFPRKHHKTYSPPFSAAGIKHFRDGYEVGALDSTIKNNQSQPSQMAFETIDLLVVAGITRASIFCREEGLTYFYNRITPLVYLFHNIFYTD